MKKISLFISSILLATIFTSCTTETVNNTMIEEQEKPITVEETTKPVDMEIAPETEIKGVNLSFDVKETSVQKGDTIITDIVLTADQEIATVDIYVNFDADMLRVKQVEHSKAFENYGKDTIDETGKVKIVAFSQGEKFIGKDTVATIEFEILKAGETELTFDYEEGSQLDCDAFNIDNDPIDLLDSVNNVQLTIS